MNLNQKFILVFALIGLVVSLVSGGIIAGNRLTHVLLVGFLCTVVSGILGYVAYRVLEVRVPEFLEFLEGLSVRSAGGAESESSDYRPEDYEEEPDYDQAAYEEADEEDVNTQEFGDHILAGNVKLKNEPKLMAKAIQTMLARDEDS